MIGSLYSGISGLKANTSAMAVIGDNIANVATTGFKSSKVSFANIFSSSIGQSGLEIGRGVSMSGVSPLWDSGSLENSTSVTDLSVNGKGMFVVQDSTDGAQYFTRAGKFEFDRNGNLVNSDGLNVQGYPIDTTGNSGSMTDISLPNGTNAPRETDEIIFEMNLDSGASNADAYATTITVFDSLGSQVELDFNFTYDAANTEWDWALTPSSGACATTGSLVFDANGNLDAANCTPPSANPALVITGLAGNDLNIDWTYLNNANTTDGSIIGYSARSTKTSQSQNGYASGSLQGVSVDDNGVFTGLYSNGTMTPFAQIALGDFASYSGLAKKGSNLFGASLESGQAMIGQPNSASLGAVAPSTLEMSNVDLATEFVQLITTQRAFQANSKVITTSDEILAELINIKR